MTRAEHLRAISAKIKDILRKAGVQVSRVETYGDSTTVYTRHKTSAEKTAALLRQAGWQNVRIIETIEHYQTDDDWRGEDTLVYMTTGVNPE